MTDKNNHAFAIDKEGIDPNSVPSYTLNNGVRIPSIGLGTFGSDHVTAEAVADAVVGAAEYGYRMFDCASVYCNEKEIGQALQVILKGGVPREELFITSKAWNNMHGKGQIIESCKQSLQDLQLDYLDLFLVHWPFPNSHPPGCSVDSLNPEAKAYIHEDYMQTWDQMQQLVAMGLVRSIGTSNMTIAKLELMLPDCSIRPAVNEMENHPHFQQPELFDYLIKNSIRPVGFCPLGSPGRPERDRTPDDSVDMEDPVIVQVAQAHEIHPAAVCLKWAVQRGLIVIPFSAKKRNYATNLACLTKDPLTDEEMARIAGIDKKCRLVKGQVFRWRENQNWEDLWDEDGTIAN